MHLVTPIRTLYPSPSCQNLCKCRLNLSRRMKCDIKCHMPNIHYNRIVQGQYCPIIFLITNIFFGLGLYPTPTAIAIGSNCKGELGGCSSTLVSHLAAKTNSIMEFWYTSRHLDGPISVKWPRYLRYLIYE